MSDNEVGKLSDSGSPATRPTQLVVLVVLLFVESLMVFGAAAYLLIELLIDTPASYPSAIAILVLTVAAAAWITVIAVKVLAGQQWTRAATIVWQVLQASIGLGSLQGMGATPEVGWPLIILAAVVAVLLFTKPVLAATTQVEELQADEPPSEEV